MSEQGRDPRVYFAAERTFLAWIRTGLALMGFGFVVARFGMFLREIGSTAAAIPIKSSGFSLLTGTALVLIGVAVNGISAFQHLKTIRDLNKDDLVQGTVTRILPYGAFVDIGIGRDALLHVREMGVGYVAKPEDVVKVGDNIEARIIELSRRRGRVDLSLKGLREEPEPTPPAPMEPWAAPEQRSGRGRQPEPESEPEVEDDFEDLEVLSPMELAFKRAMEAEGMELNDHSVLIDGRRFSSRRLTHTLQQADAHNVVVDIGRAHDMLKKVLGELNYKNLDTLPQFKGKLTTTEALSRYIFERFEAAGLTKPGYDAGAASRIASQWSLPLNNVAVDLLRVPDDALQAQRHAWLAAQHGFPSNEYI